MTSKVKPYTGRRILIWFVGFFMVIFTANGIMTYFALNTWTGLKTENSYVKGLNYNQEIHNAKQQQASGWHIDIFNKPMKTIDRFELNLTRPIESLPPISVETHFVRAVQEGFDQKVTLSHLGNGVYGSPIKLPLIGQWDVLVVVNAQNGITYKYEDRLLVK
ncbi:MAG: FixH family protein [Kordiimonadaceae bacterium]|jgi:nitrogen fixation protein FixH|nr:FixH family protein [Kordiimonadaceae bacterium]MBT6032250.1 FixH family protein [Kordiimonadaceae bacterium]